MYIKQRLYGSSLSRLNDVCMHNYINIHVYVCMFVLVFVWVWGVVVCWLGVGSGWGRNSPYVM